MSLAPIPRPEGNEFAEFYRGYVAEAGEGDLRALLAAQPQELRRLAGGLSDDAALHRYAAGKWSIKEVIGHLNDAERVFSYRLFRIGRGDASPLAGFDENSYVAAADFDRRPLAALLDELEILRRGTLAVIEPIAGEAWAHLGTANGYPVSARALPHIIAGHFNHHVKILRERYGL